jgi:4'-phosphopantetheinyl transferase
MPQAPWLTRPQQLILDSSDVHVWCAALDQESSVWQKLLETLTPDEQQRADRFHFQKDRDRFIVARGVLRNILSLYLGISPVNLRFLYSKHGKPSLSHETTTVPLHFNLSHAHEFALCAVSKTCQVGIDLEYLHHNLASLEIAQGFFSPDEVAMLRSLPENLRTRGFFSCWTRKEAYIKGLGEGLSHPLDSFTVSLIPGEPAWLHAEDSRQPSNWSLVPIPFKDNYSAALAVKGSVSTIHFWNWT